MFGSFFEQDHLLNLIILRVYAKRSPKCAGISKQKLRTIHRGKKYGVWSKILEKRKLYTVEAVEAVVILQQANFYDIFILCLWLRIIRISDQGV